MFKHFAAVAVLFASSLAACSPDDPNQAAKSGATQASDGSNRPNGKSDFDLRAELEDAEQKCGEVSVNSPDLKKVLDCRHSARQRYQAEYPEVFPDNSLN